MQALLTTVAEPRRRSVFLSANSALQALGTGCGAWLGGLMLSTTASGRIASYGTVGWAAVAITMCAILWVGRVKAVADNAPLVAVGEFHPEPLGEA